MKILAWYILSLFSCVIVSAQTMVASEAELKTALLKVQPGETIIWKNGSYNNTFINFNPKIDGKLNALIVLKAETPGKVVFKGNSKLIVKGNYLLAEGFFFEGKSTLEKGDVMAFDNTAEHCRISNCAVKNYSPADDFANNNWISIQGIENELDHCYFSGKTNQGPYLVVRYKTGDDYVSGSDAAPSTRHHIHHNYFGLRTLPTDNGGEDMRIGDSKTSFTHGFNIIEYNYFEDQRLEPEVISNKSWDNIYRFNTFMNNDGAMVLRHGQKCFVYGNYFSAKTGRGTSGGIRIINPNQTVFNNYLENLEGGEKPMKAPICIMNGLKGSAINEYFPADSSVVFHNTIYNSVGPAIAVGEGNTSKGKPFDAAKNMVVANNIIVNVKGENKFPVMAKDENASYTFINNVFSNAKNSYQGFNSIKSSQVKKKNGFISVEMKLDTAIVNIINARLAIHNISLSEKEMTNFNSAWKLKKEDLGVTWMK